MKIVVISHGHPVFSKGGAEISAYNLYQAYLAAGHESSFLARVSPAAFENMSIVHYAPNEYLLGVNQRDAFYSLTESPYAIARNYCNLIEKLSPDFIHFHHYSHIGLEIFHATRKVLPNVKIALTLHEYIAICHQSGQMVKAANMELCNQENFFDCKVCFPQYSINQFFLRKQYFMDTFKLIDFFIAPSHFLKTRYTRWGLDAEKIHVVENGLSQSFLETVISRRDFLPQDKPLVLGYFGQINKFKGITLLLEAFESLSSGVKEQAILKIYGAGLETQTKEYQEKFNAFLEKAEGRVIYYGKYETGNLPDLLAEVHYVVMPSIWWENSPVVIQEAHSMGRPVICADIGGMQEKVKHMRNGIHFSARSIISLRNVLETIITNFSIYTKLRENCKISVSAQESQQQILEILRHISLHQN